MRILQIHPLMKSEALAPAAGGMARASLQLTRLMTERGHEVQVLPIPEGVGARELWEVAPGRAVEVAAAMHIPGAKDLPRLAWAVLRLRPLPAGVKNLFYDAFALTALRREMELFRPEIVHNHLARMPFARLARALGLRGNLVLTHHHGQSGEGLGVYDRVVFPSRSSLEHIAVQRRLPQNRMRAIHYPVSPVFCRRPVETGRDRRGVMFIGAVRLRKGIDLLLDAYRSDAGLWKEPLLVCGRGEDEGLVRQAVGDGLPVTALGQLAPQELAERLTGIRLVVIPSRLENFSIALLEALCSGVPVIGWAPQIREMEAVLGMPVGAGFESGRETAEDLARRIREALRGDADSPAYRRALADAARKAFSEERYAEAYLDLFREMLGS
ncbi:MAG: glycosyltransferase family 4 protein [Anaerolineales bacterium]|nr:glycosyltransferase family 4 protein [Anaerolineales bacterium]